MPSKHIADGTSGDGEKSGPRETVKEPCYEHGLDVASHRAGNYPNDEHEIGPDVNWATSIELSTEEAQLVHGWDISER